MNREKVDSSSLREMGWDQSGSEVQFHSTDCAGSTWKPTGPAGKMELGKCNCAGGKVYHYPGVPEELHKAVMGAESVGRAYATMIKGARHPQTKALLYPHVAREAAKA